MIIFGYTSAFFKQWLYFAFKGARSIDRTWYLDIRLFSALDCCEIAFFLILSRQQSPFNRFHSIFPIVHSILYLFRKKIKSAECETGFRQRFANGCFASIFVYFLRLPSPSYLPERSGIAGASFLQYFSLVWIRLTSSENWFHRCCPNECFDFDPPMLHSENRVSTRFLLFSAWVSCVTSDWRQTAGSHAL